MASSQSKAADYSYQAQQLIEMGQIEARVVDLAEVYLEVIRTGRQLDLAEENVEPTSEPDESEVPPDEGEGQESIEAAINSDRDSVEQNKELQE